MYSQNTYLLNCGMDRIFTYEITNEYDGMKVYEYLRRQGFSRQNLTDIRFKEYPIFVNEQRVYRNHILKAKDLLKIYINEQDNSKNIPPVDIPIEVLFEDEDILVVNKPSGMPIHPSLNNYENSLGNAVMFYYNSRGYDFVYRCINRLDRDTSGPVIIAKNIISASVLGDQQKNGGIQKEYVAIVSGNVTDDAGTINLPIGRVKESSIERRVDYENGKDAVTNYWTVFRNDDYSVVKLKLDTGRTHQIRVHMKAIGHPLAGDFLYNPSDKTMDRQALHVRYISFLHPISKKTMEITVPIPSDMRVLIPDDSKLQ